MVNKAGKKMARTIKTLPRLVLATIFLGGCIAAVPIAIHYYQTDKNYVATATIQKSADEVWQAILDLKEEAETERKIEIVKQDDAKRQLKATDGVQNAEIKVLDEGSRTSKIIVMADVPVDDQTKELAKEKELASRIMNNICAQAKADCKLVEK